MALTGFQKAGFGLADMGVVVFVVVKQLLVLNYLTAYLGVPVGIAGLVTTAVLIFDILTDPLVGYLSDRTQSRHGRRAPWMFWGALVMVAGTIGLFAVPAGYGLLGNLLWVVGFFGIATIGFTIVAVPYCAQSGEISTDAHERSVMTGWRMGFASLGILIGGALIPGLAESMGHARAVLAVSPLIVGSIWLSVFATRRAPRVAASPGVGVAQMVRLVAANTPFMALTGLYGVMTLAIATITAGLPFAAVYLIVDNGQTALSGAASALGTLSLVFAAFVVGAILSQPFWIFLSRRMGKANALIVGLLLYIALLVWLWSLLPITDVTLIAAAFVIAGMANGAYQQIPFALYPDHMDLTRAESGIAIEGAFSSVWLFGQKVANALAPACLGGLLSLRGWQEATEGQAVAQTDVALDTLRQSITLFPATVLLIAILGLVMIHRPLVRAAQR